MDYSEDQKAGAGQGIPSPEDFEIASSAEEEVPDSPYADQDEPAPSASTEVQAPQEEADSPVYPQDLVADKPAPIRILLISNMPRIDESDHNLKVDLAQVDLVVSLGNVDLTALERMMLPQTQGVCVFAPKDPLVAPARFHRLHGNGITFRGWKIAGLSGSLANGPNPGGLYMDPDDAFSMLENLPACDIFVTHSPPRDIRESPISPGLTMPAIDEYIKTKFPIYHFYSHPAMNEAVEAYGGEFETITVGVSGFQLAPLIEYV